MQRNQAGEWAPFSEPYPWIKFLIYPNLLKASLVQFDHQMEWWNEFSQRDQTPKGLQPERWSGQTLRLSLCASIGSAEGAQAILDVLRMVWW